MAVNWKYKDRIIDQIEDFPEGCIGFIYIVYNLSKMKSYVGKKDLYSHRNIEVSKKTYDKLKKEGFPVKRTENKKESKKQGKKVWRYKKQVDGESDWKTYVGSNTEIKKDVKNGDKIQRTILRFCYNKKQLSYYETKAQFNFGVIEPENSHLYYNGNILGKFYTKDLL